MRTDFSDREAVESVVSRALGDEIRRLRDAAGMSRASLIERMGSDIHAQTLATYEAGSRQCTVTRFVEICMALGVAPSDVLGLALQRAEIDLLKNGMRVDLRAIIADNRAEMTLIRKWARKRLAADPNGSGVVRIGGSAIQELAILSDYADHEQLIDELLKFSPQRAPQGTARRRPA
jgi:transcriptional regulator with XRE-family HTH domain